MISNDERLRISEAIREKWGPIADGRGLRFVPLESRTVLLVSSRAAVIDNGGFEYLLEGPWKGDEELQQAIAAFRRIGCEEAANLVSFVMSHYLLQDGSSSLDAGERLAALEAAFPTKDAREELDRRFCAQRPQIHEKLAAYVFANMAQIVEQLKPSAE